MPTRLSLLSLGHQCWFSVRTFNSLFTDSWNLSAYVNWRKFSKNSHLRWMWRAELVKTGITMPRRPKISPKEKQPLYFDKYLPSMRVLHKKSPWVYSPWAFVFYLLQSRRDGIIVRHRKSGAMPLLLLWNGLFYYYLIYSFHQSVSFCQGNDNFLIMENIFKF